MTLKKPTPYYDRFILLSEENPDKAVLSDVRGNSAGYSDFINVYDSVQKFFLENGIEEYDRIGVFSNDPINMMLMLLPVTDNSTRAYVDPGLSEDRYPEIFDLLSVSYIITDDPDLPGCKAALKKGLGVISYKISGGFNSRECSLEMLSTRTLDTDKLVKTPGLVIVNMTSGTTSIPKIVPRKYREYVSYLDKKIEFYGYGPDDTELVIMKAFKSMAILAVLSNAYAGGSAVIADEFNYNDLKDILVNNKITSITTNPAILSAYEGYIKDNNIDMSNIPVRLIIASGALVSASLREFYETLFDARVADQYGMSEVSAISSTYKEPKGFKPGSSGIPIYLDVKVHEGEILVKGESVFEGYENAEIDNSIYFTDGWFHTGDMGYIDEDGYIFITGRIKEMINKGGEKISPYEVEEKILRHPDIRDAAVFPYSNEYGSENAGAVIVMEKDTDITLSQLRSYLSDSMQSFKMPTLLYKVDSIPRSQNNKIQRKLLFDILKTEYQGSGEALGNNGNSKAKADTKTEKMVLKIFRKALNSNKIGPEDKFIDVGGDSLNGTIVLSEIDSKLGIRIPVKMLFEGGTVRQICGFIEEEKSKWDKYRYLAPIKSTGSKKPLICVHSPFGDAATYRFIGRYMEEDRPVIGICFNRKGSEWEHPVTFKQMAKRYIEEIVEYDPEGPYYLSGFCYGGILAFKMAVMMKEAGHDVRLLVMMDSAAKSIVREKPLVKHGIFHQISARFKDMRKQFRNTPDDRKIRFLFYKIKKFFVLIDTYIKSHVYWFAAKKNSRFLLKITGGYGALEYAYNKYRPEHYNGKLHFIKAMLRLTPNEHEKYWEQFADDFVLFKMQCRHSEIIIGEHSQTLVQYLMQVLEEADA